jgi:hypothetical protein
MTPRESQRMNRHMSWALSRASETLLPSLVRASGLKAIRVFAQALDQEIMSEHPDAASNRKRSWVYDGSSFWLTTLTTRDDHESELKSVFGWQLVEAIRLLLEVERKQVRAVVRMLNEFKPIVFRRIQLHVLAAHTEGNVAMAYTWLRKTEVLRSAELNPEYVELLNAAAAHLGDTQRTAIANLLEKTSRTRFKQGPNEQKWAAQWLRDRLVALAPFLSGEWKDKYDALVAEEGKAEPVDHGHGPITTWRGPTSPKSEQELAELSVEDLVEYLRTFMPKKTFEPGPSIEGLARTVTSVAAAAPQEYARRAELFRKLDRTYVRALLDGFRNARRANKSFDWDQVLSLALWVVEQPVPASDVDDSQAYDDADPSWRWSRKSLADLVTSGFHGEGKFPFVERERIWTIIEKLSDDPNPSPEHEAKYGGTNMDPYTLAINTVRPQALDAAIQYAFWVRRNIVAESARNDRPDAGFSFAPEAAELLEQHLVPERDRSQAVRAAIGHWLASLVWFDASWVKRNWECLFPERPDLVSLAQATWGAHVLYGRIFTSTFELAPMYRAALLHPVGVDKNDNRNPDSRLAEHILTFYWWGLITLEAPDNLVALLFNSGSARQKQHAIEYVGQSLGRTDEAIPADVLDRIQKLWDWRFPVLAAEAKSADAATKEAAIEELEEFGHWFASKKLNVDWALPRFDAVIEITGGTERGRSALEFLAEVAKAMPLAAASTLEKFSLAPGKDPWRFHLWKEPAMEIMRTALNSTESGASEKAKLLINKWMANVSPEYKQLLER